MGLVWKRSQLQQQHPVRNHKQLIKGTTQSVLKAIFVQLVTWKTLKNYVEVYSNYSVCVQHIAVMVTDIDFETLRKKW